MNRRSLSLAVAGTLLMTAAGCADLVVPNENEPEAARALATAGDVESLIAGSFRQYFYSGVNGSYDGPSYFLAAQAFQHSAWPANAGVVDYSKFPRIPVQNTVVDPYYSNVEEPWEQNYKALAVINQGLRSLASDTVVANKLRDDDDGDRLARLELFSKFVQGLAHGHLAMLYDQAFILDETVEVDLETFEIMTPGADEMKPYMEVMDAAIGYLDEAIALARAAQAGGSAPNIPGGWMASASAVTPGRIIGYANAMKARFMAAVARTPAERASRDWAGIEAALADATPWVYDDLEWFDYSNWATDLNVYTAFGGWQQLTYWILGMADQSGKYQEWVAVPNPDKIPDLDMDNDPSNGFETPFIIDTPDRRFSQAKTLDALLGTGGGEVFGFTGVKYTKPYWSYATNFQKPDRGTWRWSYYYWNEGVYSTFFTDQSWPEVPQAEIDLLLAEAHWRQGDMAAAGAIVDDYRVDRGGMDSSLDDTDLDGDPNDMCVPKLPDGSCGDFFEMLKWEKRIATQYKGMMQAPWYFEGRGWGDLYEGTPLQFPVPCRELAVLEMSCYTFGGPGGQMGSPGSVYDFPTEGT